MLSAAKHPYNYDAAEDASLSKAGFSLIELLVILALILLLAAIAIPKLLHSRIAANEATAISSIQSINAAQLAYKAAYPDLGYASDLATLGPTPGRKTCDTPSRTHACLIEAALAKATSQATPRSGYWYSVAGQIAGGPVVTNYQAAAAASAFNQTGVRSFCSVEDRLLRFAVPASQDSPTSYTGSPDKCTKATSILQ